jgi:hypothetical protein
METPTNTTPPVSTALARGDAHLSAPSASLQLAGESELLNEQKGPAAAVRHRSSAVLPGKPSGARSSELLLAELRELPLTKAGRIATIVRPIVGPEAG